jgi:hypothetical protein
MAANSRHELKGTSMRKTILLIAVLLVGSVLAGPAAAHPPGHAHGKHDSSLGAQLAEVRAATARYHDVDVADSDGYVEMTDCVEHPVLGAMGYHYVNVDLMGQLDPTKPQALLYVPWRNGELRLAGVEYLGQEGQRVLGQPLVPGPGGHALHVWVWQNNPAGMFADFNPRLSC